MSRDINLSAISRERTGELCGEIGAEIVETRRELARCNPAQAERLPLIRGTELMRGGSQVVGRVWA
jgi:hypothetical protein